MLLLMTGRVLMCAVRKKDQEVWILQLGKQAGLVKHVFWKNDRQQSANRDPADTPPTDLMSSHCSAPIYSAVYLSTIHTSSSFDKASHSHCYFFFCTNICSVKYDSLLPERSIPTHDKYPYRSCSVICWSPGPWHINGS